ncbi:hypothetical protein [Embleya sp. NPDC059237]|uniref:hypothetical protein n=1 Tax=Embleya sp. NPDC059237 TaxID=3346784 RepID=UPI003689F45E
MISYPESDEVLAGLGSKVVQGLVHAVVQARADLLRYRMREPAVVAQHSERGLANWIHDRMWAHLVAVLDGHPEVTLSEGEPTRELVVGLRYRLRIKRHRDGGQVSSYGTQTALEFFAQGHQDTFPGLEELRLTAGYEWDADARDIGDAVLSLRDGKDHIVWLEHLVDTGELGGSGAVQPVRPSTPSPALPSIEVPGFGQHATTEDERK